MKTKFLFMLLLPLLMGASCKKINFNGETVDYLTDETQIGANTFSCIIDGKVFKAKTSFDHKSPNASYTFKNGIAHLIVTGINYSNYPMLSIGLEIKADNLPVGNYLLDKTISYLYSNSLGGGGSYSITQNNANMNNYQTTTNNKGTLTLTKVDLNNHIVSGRFEMEVINDTGEKIVITDGRFDLKY